MNQNICVKRVLIDLQEIPHEPFIPLTKEEESLVKRAFSPNNGYGLINFNFGSLAGACYNAIGVYFPTDGRSWSLTRIQILISPEKFCNALDQAHG